jgi:CRISPR/Cas system-associated exonuclease Cas4 (RecB family)
MSDNLISTLIVIALISALILFTLSFNESKRIPPPPPSREILYDSSKKDSKLLVADTYQLEARPMLVIREGEETRIVLSYDKESPPATSPTDIMRIAAESIVVAEALHVSPTIGIIQYTDRELRVPITPALHELAIKRLIELRASETKIPILKQQDPQICQVCFFHSICSVGRNISRAIH